ncbi:MAG: ABC transporter permease [Propionicimonas sp.]|uniref:ABC transporter permease n=1 Tax=Propionicimonas sp. TaxID=1955623 RepID=UPI003D128A6A
MSLAEVAAEHGLHRVGARPRFGHYLREAWTRRDFVIAMAQYRLRADLEGNRLGVLWLVLQPALNAAIYGAIFGLLQGNARGADFPAHVVIGVFLWQFFAKCLTNGAKSITGNQALVQSLAFPRITLPISEVIEQFLSLMPSMLLLVVILPFFGHWPTWSWLLMIPLLVLYSLFNTGIALIAARLTVHVRDLTQLLPFISRILFYTSGVLFNVDNIFKAHPLVVRLYDFHPLYQVLQMARSSLMGGHDYNPFYWLYFSVWAVVVLVFGLLFFWVAEERYGRD